MAEMVLGLRCTTTKTKSDETPLSTNTSNNDTRKKQSKSTFWDMISKKILKKTTNDSNDGKTLTLLPIPEVPETSSLRNALPFETNNNITLANLKMSQENQRIMEETQRTMEENLRIMEENLSLLAMIKHHF